MAIELEERLNLHGFKPYEIADAIVVLDRLVSRGKFNNDNPESRYRFCLKVIENARQKPQAKTDDFNLHVAENLFEHLEEKHGVEWMRDKFKEVQALEHDKPSLYATIRSHAKSTRTYHKHLISKKCELDPSERIELEQMVLKYAHKPRETVKLNEAEQKIADKVNRQMKSIENQALAKAMVCVYVCNYMDKSLDTNDDIEF